MTYGQQPDPARPEQPADGGVPPIPPAPAAPAQGYGSPQQPSTGYGAPQQPSTGYGAPQQPSSGYGAPGAPPAAGAYGGGPAPWGGAQAPAQRPGQTTGGAIMAIIGGALLVILGLILAGVGANPDVVSQAGLPSEFASLMATMGVVALLMGALSVVFGIFVMRRAWWAAIALAVMAALYVVGSIVNVVNGAPQGLIGVIWVGISTALILSPQSRAWLRSGR